MMPAPIPQQGGKWLDSYVSQSDLAPEAPAPGLLNWAAILGILFRQRWVIICTMVIALMGGVVATLLTTPTYEAFAKVRISPAGTNILDGQDVDQGVASNQVGEFIATQVEIIKSRTLAKVVVSDLKLGERSDLLDAEVDQSRPPNMTDKQWLEARNEMATSILADSVVVEPPTNSWVVQIGFRSKDPVLAAEIANGYSDAFVASGTRGKIDNNAYALSYLRDQIESTRARLQDAEQAANAFSRQSGIVVQQETVSAEGETSATTLTNANLAAVNARVSAARAARIEAEQRWRSIENLPASQLPEVQANPVLQSLLSDRTAKSTQLAELRQRYNDDFPQIVTLRTQIGIIDSQLQRSSSDVKQAVRNAYIVARNQEQALTAELSTITGETLREQDQQVQLSSLDRDAQALRDQLRALLDRFNQINSAAQVDTGVITPLDPATVPDEPFSPSLMRNLALALLMGIGVAGGLGFILEIFDDRARSLEDVEVKIGLPLLGHTPYINEHSKVSTQSADRFSSLMEAYSSIRATIDFSIPRSKNVLQLTSSQAAEGKSTTTVILAELFANLGRKTLLIDADLRRPSVAKLLDVERPTLGLVEVVLGHCSLEDAIIKGVHENLDIVPVGAIPTNPADILSSDEFREFIGQMREKYSLVLIDSCPVMGLADAPILSRVADYTIFVLEANRVPFSQARTAARRITSVGSEILGVIFTKFRALEAGQSYSYQYEYYQYGNGDKG